MIRVAPGVDLGSLITSLLGLARMTPAELARAAGYAEGQISKWRRGVVIPSAPVLLRLFAATGYDLALADKAEFDLRARLLALVALWEADYGDRHVCAGDLRALLDGRYDPRDDLALVPGEDA